MQPLDLGELPCPYAIEFARALRQAEQSLKQAEPERKPRGPGADR